MSKPKRAVKRRRQSTNKLILAALQRIERSLPIHLDNIQAELKKARRHPK